MAGTINLFLNRNNTGGLKSGLVKSATELSPVNFPPLVVGDSKSFKLQITEGDTDGTLEDLTGYSIKLGVGNPGATPTGGTWTIGDGTDTTSALQYNAAASAVQTALNALNTSTGPFGDTVTVSGAAGGPYKITFDSNGSQPALTVTTSSLTPESGATVSELTAGDGSTQEVQAIQLYQQPYVLVSSWTISTTTATASVDLTDYDLYSLVAAESDGELETYVEIEVTDASGNVATLARVPVIVSAEVLPTGAGSGSLNFTDFATQAYVDSRVYKVKVDSGDASPDFLDNKVANSVVITAGDTLELDGDASTPGNHFFYSTDETGSKGWERQTAHLIYLDATYG